MTQKIEQQTQEPSMDFPTADDIGNMPTLVGEPEPSAPRLEAVRVISHGLDYIGPRFDIDNPPIVDGWTDDCKFLALTDFSGGVVRICVDDISVVLELEFVWTAQECRGHNHPLIKHLVGEEIEHEPHTHWGWSRIENRLPTPEGWDDEGNLIEVADGN